jgi:hypothetical protein
MKRPRFTIASALLLAGLIAVPIATVDAAITARAAGAATFTVQAILPNGGAGPAPLPNGNDTGRVVSGSITLTASGTWCTNHVPEVVTPTCNGPNGSTTWPSPRAADFLIDTPSVLPFGLVGRIGTTGPWSVVGAGPTTLNGTGELFLAMNDQRGQFGDNTGALQVTYQALSIPGTNPPASSSIVGGDPAAWAVPITNNSPAPMTGITATFHAAANGSTPLTFNQSMMPGCSPGAGNSEVCNVADIAANSTRQFNVFADTAGLAKGTTITGDVTVGAATEANVTGTLGTVTVASVPARLSIPQLNPPVAPTITSGQRAAWTVPISNISNAPLTGVTATFKASSGTTPLTFDGTLMTGCAAGAGNSEVCSLPNIPANTSIDFSAFADADALSNGKTIGGVVMVAATGETTVAGFLGTVTVVACGSGCVISVGAPGAPVASSSGPPTDAQPTKQIVSFPNIAKGAPPVAITLQSVSPGPKLSNADKLLCPLTTPCSGQISVVGGNFKKYVDKAHPLQIQIIAKWKTVVPPGRILMAKPGNPPIQLAACVKKAGKYNTPCELPEVVKGSAATNNLVTIDTIYFVAADPRMARHIVLGPDAPTAVRAIAGKRKATVTWKAPIVTNGRLIKYTVTPYLGKVAKPSVSVAGNLLKGTVTGLTSGKTYTFKVIAKTLLGISLASKASNAVKIT